MKKRAAVIIVAIIIIVILIGLLIYKDVLDKKPEIVEYGITPEDVKVGELVTISIKARDDKGLLQIGIQLQEKNFWTDCGGEKTCEYVGEFTPIKAGTYEIIFGAIDSSNNQAIKTISKVVTRRTNETNGRPPLKSDSIEHGKLEQINGVWFLKLEGSPYEIGYAHGYLLAPQIIEGLKVVGIENPEYEQKRDNSVKNYRFSQDRIDEMQGILEGIKDTEAEETSGQEISIGDIKLINVINEKINPACTSISVWGDLTENADTITARGLGFPILDKIGSFMLDYTVIFAYEPEGENNFISVGYPGLIGCITCVNEKGFSIYTDNGVERKTITSPPYDISLLLMRDFMEDSDIDEVEEIKTKIYSGKNPSTDRSLITSEKYGEQGVIAVSYELDNQGSVLRFPSDDHPESPNRIFDANQFLKLRGPVSKNKRYLLVDEKIKDFESQGILIGKEQMNEIYRDIAELGSDVDNPAQHHQLIANLNDLSFDFYLAEIDANGEVTLASKAPKKSFEWQQIFS